MKRDIGCLLIDDPLCNLGALDPLADALSRRGMRAETFRWNGTERLYPALQNSYQRVRRDGSINAMAAIGAGCDCAVALACQLPAERLALLYPERRQGSGDIARQMRRIRAFARQNAAFCVADVLIVLNARGREGGDVFPGRIMRGLGGGQVTLLHLAEELWLNRKEVLNLGIFGFLRDGVLPKSLAENPEMCIIYG